MDVHFRVLGLQRGCSSDEVKRAYRQKALDYHPDRNPNGADAFKRVNAAYEAIQAHFKRYGGVDGGPRHQAGPSTSSSYGGGGASSSGARGFHQTAAPREEEPLMTEAELFSDMAPGGWASAATNHRRMEQRWRRAHGQRPPASGYYSPNDNTAEAKKRASRKSDWAEGEGVADAFKKMYERHMGGKAPGWAAEGSSSGSPTPPPASSDSATPPPPPPPQQQQQQQQQEESSAGAGKSTAGPSSTTAGGSSTRNTHTSAGTGGGQRVPLRAEWERLEKKIASKMGERRAAADDGGATDGAAPAMGSTPPRPMEPSAYARAAKLQEEEEERQRQKERREWERQQRHREEEAAEMARLRREREEAQRRADEEAAAQRARRERDIAHRNAVAGERRLLQRQLLIQQYSPDPAAVGAMSDVDVYLLYNIFSDVAAKLRGVVVARMSRGTCTRCGNRTGHAKWPQSSQWFTCHAKRKDGDVAHSCLCVSCAAEVDECPLCGAPAVTTRPNATEASGTGTYRGAASPPSPPSPPPQQQQQSAGAAGTASEPASAMGSPNLTQPPIVGVRSSSLPVGSAYSSFRKQQRGGAAAGSPPPAVKLSPTTGNLAPPTTTGNSSSSTPSPAPAGGAGGTGGSVPDSNGATGSHANHSSSASPPLPSVATGGSGGSVGAGGGGAHTAASSPAPSPSIPPHPPVANRLSSGRSSHSSHSNNMSTNNHSSSHPLPAQRQTTASPTATATAAAAGRRAADSIRRPERKVRTAHAGGRGRKNVSGRAAGGLDAGNHALPRGHECEQQHIGGSRRRRL